MRYLSYKSKETKRSGLLTSPSIYMSLSFEMKGPQ